MTSRWISSFLFLAFSLLSTETNAYNYPELDWRRIETEHFVIHFYDEVSWTAQKVARVAEDIYPKVTGYLDHEPSGKTNIVVRDDEDKSNGFAVFQLNWMVIWASPSSHRLRSRGDWIRDVITHEFAHVVSLQKASSGGWLIEGLRFGGVANGNTKENTDVGGTTFILPNPYSRWWAEGIAQISSDIAGHDTFGSLREMLLRTCMMEDNLLNFNEMRNIAIAENFGGELVYNQGYAFLLWLSEKFGKTANAKLTRTSGENWILDFDETFPKAFGKSAKELHRQWIAESKLRYKEKLRRLVPKVNEGSRIHLMDPSFLEMGHPKESPYLDGVFLSHPRYSKDGHLFLWSNGGKVNLKYLDQPNTVGFEKEEDEDLDDRLLPLQLSFRGSTYSLSDDSKTLILSRRRPNALNGFPYYDLWKVDLSEVLEGRKRYLSDYKKASSPRERERVSDKYDVPDVEPLRITKKLRAMDPALSPDGENLAISINRDGHRDLKLFNLKTKKTKDLLAIGGDTEITEAAWSPDGKHLAFTLFHRHQADIWLMEVATGKKWPLTKDAADDRHAVFSRDGTFIYFSSDRKEIFQIYRLPVSTVPGTKPEQVTSVETGAFHPSFSSDGKKMVYSRFSSYGFKPYEIDLAPPPERIAVANIGFARNDVTIDSPENFPETESKDEWFSGFRPPRLFPSFIFEDEQFKAGLAIQLSDYLEKHNFSLLGLFGQDQDYQIEYRNKMFYPDILARYTAYIRNSRALFFNDGDNLADEPDTILRDGIQFLNTGFSQDFYVDEYLPGYHQLSLTYNRRWVDRRTGIPLVLNNSLVTSFRLLTNDGFTLAWNMERDRNRRARDRDINPRKRLEMGASYSLVRTKLVSPDTSIPTPNQKYFYHEGTAYLARYFAMPWRSQGWDHHTFWLRFNGGYKSRNVNGNDEFFLGGRLNFRAFGEITSNTLFYGYEDFSISGETLLLLSTGYTFPIKRRMAKKWGFLFMDAIYATIFAEAGNAWTHGEFRNQDQVPAGSTGQKGTILLTDVGAEIKIKSFLFNETNAWNSIARVAYGFQDNAANGFSDNDWPIRLFFGVGTNF